MPEVIQVERRLTAADLGDGCIPLGPKEAEALGLAQHLVEIEIRHGEERFHATWHSSDRRLVGEKLSDVLQWTAQEGWFARLHKTADSIVLELIEPARTRLSETPLFQRVSVQPSRQTGRSPKRPKTDRRDQRFRFKPREEYRWYGHVGIHEPTLNQFVLAIQKGGWDDEDSFQLRLAGERLAAVNDFEELLAIDLAKIDHMPHQEATAVQVLSRMRGRAILADEVGLGKTIEAGLIIKELILRGMVRRVLVLCPATLREQWRDELAEKFDEHFEIAFSGADVIGMQRRDRLIMSLDLATRNADRLTTLDQEWDLVIVDEAHKLAGHAKRRQELVRALSTKHMLFLTATPVQNDLLELYRLVNLVRPGTFVNERAFKREFLLGTKDKRQPRNPAELRRLVSEAMVRTTREQAGVDNVHRHAHDRPIDLSVPERAAYDLCKDVLRKVMTDPLDGLRRRQLAHRLTTSPRALSGTAMRISQTHPDERVRNVLRELADLCIDFGVTERQKAALALTEKWRKDVSKGKVLVFTQHADTLEDLLRIYAECGVEAVPYHGGLSSTAKRASIDRFRTKCPVMVSTDAGAEGLNLQFANCVLNYDLPWNPMRIEQRIGRVHRVTQHRDVYVANLYARDTVDEDVYRLLHDKLRMFELLFGQVTTVMGELEADDGSGDTFEGQILHALLAPDDVEMSARIEKLGRRVDRAYQAARAQSKTSRSLTWMADMSHRRKLSKQASELMPEIQERARRRQAQVREFVRKYLEMAGAQTIHSTEEFLTAEVPEAIQGELDGRTHLHLALTAEGLSQHPDAELCAVGSEVFECLVRSIQESGDLHATVSEPPTPGDDWTPSASDVALVDRTVMGPKGLAGELLWRTLGEGGSGDAVVPTLSGDEELLISASGRTLADGEMLPDSLGSAAEVLSLLATDAVEDLEAQRAVLQGLADEAAAKQFELLDTHYDESIREVRSELEMWREFTWNRNIDREQELEGKIAKIERARDADAATMAAPAVDLRAELLAARVVAGEPFLVREVWRNSRGIETAVLLDWRPSHGPPRHVFNGTQITTLAMCDDGHIIDATDRATCPGCQIILCPDCTTRWPIQECALCHQGQCQVCVREGVCVACSSPERAPELDDNFTIAWRTATGALVAVGDGLLRLRDTNGCTTTYVSSVDGAGSTVGWLGDVAVGLGLPQNLGLRLTERPARRKPGADALVLSETQTFTWFVDPAGGRDVMSLEPQSRFSVSPSDPPKSLEGNVATMYLSLVALEEPPLAPKLVGVRTRAVTCLEPRNGRLCVIRRTEGEDGHSETVWPAHLKREKGDAPDMVGRLRVGGTQVAVRRINDSYRIEMLDGEKTSFEWVPGRGHPSEAEEAAVAQLASTLDIPEGMSLVRDATEPSGTWHAAVRALDKRRRDLVLLADPQAWLLADVGGVGLISRSAKLGDLKVTVLAGGGRLEAACEKGASGLRWIAGDGLDESDRRLRIFLAQEANLADVDVSAERMRAPRHRSRGVRLGALPSAALSIRVLSGEEVAWEFHHHLDASGAEKQHPLDAVLDVLRLSGAMTPEPYPHHKNALQSLLPRVESAVAQCEVVLVYGEEVVEVDEDGIVVTTPYHPRPVQRRAVWQPGVGPFEDLVQRWQSEPDLLVHARDDGGAALLAKFGPYGVITLWGDEGQRTYHLGDQPGFPEALAVLDRLQLSSGRVEIVDAVAPECARLEVENGQPIRTEVEPLSRPADGERTVDEKVLLRWAEDGGVPCISVESLTSVRADLVTAWRTALGLTNRPATRIAVGARVAEYYRVAGVDTPVALTYEVWPHERPSITDHASNQPLSGRIYLDRSGHAVSADTVRRCSYCQLASCGVCAILAAPCEVCRIIVCDRCSGARTQGRCKACIALVRQRRFLKKIRSGTRALYVGADDLHEVRVSVERDGQATVDAGVHGTFRIPWSDGLIAPNQGPVVSDDGRPAHEQSTAEGAARPSEVLRVGAPDGLVTQPVTDGDQERGQIRIPRSAKVLFPATPETLIVVLDGRRVQVRWNPRLGPDRERSGVLHVGRSNVDGLTVGRRLSVRRLPDGEIRLDSKAF